MNKREAGKSWVRWSLVDTFQESGINTEGRGSIVGFE